LRRLAAQRVPSTVAWRPKSEPLNDWLLQRWVRNDASLGRALACVKRSRFLTEVIDTAAFAAAAEQARRMPKPNWFVASIVEFGALVGWMTAVEARFGL
jgi:hypothetical protein